MQVPHRIWSRGNRRRGLTNKFVSANIDALLIFSAYHTGARTKEAPALLRTIFFCLGYDLGDLTATGNYFFVGSYEPSLRIRYVCSHRDDQRVCNTPQEKQK